jgi:hypothetical protein
VSDEVEKITAHLKDGGIMGIAKAGGARRDICEHAVQVHRRA